MPSFPAALLIAATLGQNTGDTWIIQYDRERRPLHGPPTVVTERARLIMRPVKDSLIGEIVWLPRDSTGSTSTNTVRGVVRGKTWSLRVDPRPRSTNPLAAAWDIAMDYMREAMHGIVPTTSAFDLVIDGTTLRGTRTVVSLDGVAVSKPVPVRGDREAKKP